MKTNRKKAPVFLYLLLPMALLFYPAFKKAETEKCFLLKNIKIEGEQGIKLHFERLIGRDLRKINERKLENEIIKDKFVKEVRIRKIFPHTLIVSIKKRRAIACYETSNGLYTLGEEGEKIQGGCSSSLPVLLQSPLDLKFQVKFLRERKVLAAETDWIKFLSPFSIEIKPKRIDMVVLFPVENFPKRYARFKSILPEILDLGFKPAYLDFRVKGKIFIGRKR